MLILYYSGPAYYPLYRLVINSLQVFQLSACVLLPATCGVVGKHQSCEHSTP